MDALDFFVEAKSREDLEKMREAAIADGDAFVLRTIQRALPELVNDAHWQALAGNAERSGKPAFAEQAGRGGRVELPVVDAVIKEDPTAHPPDAAGAKEEAADG